MTSQKLTDALNTVIGQEFPKEYIVEEIFNPTMVSTIYKEIMATRKCVGDDEFTYSPIEKATGGKTYIIVAKHLRIGEVMSQAKSSCNKCYGSGKKMMLMGKDQIPNPNDFLMLTDTSLKGFTEEQKRIVVEQEKQKKFWKVLLPCPCTIKSMVKKGRHIVSNELNNIVAEVTCTEKIEV